jgi:diguanylate cyclase (GGDEF)-like protein
MSTLTQQSKKDELWAEVQRLRQASDSDRTRLAVLESELGKLREGQGLLEERTSFVEELSERLRTANERLEILASLTRELASFDLDGVLEVCVQRIPYLAGARFASVYLYDRERDRLVLKHKTHDREIDPEVDLSQSRDTLMAKAVRGKQVLCIGDLNEYAAEGEDPVTLPHKQRYQTSSCVVAPLLAAGEVEGVLNLADRFDRRPFDPEEELGTIRRACELVAVSLRNVRLFEEIQRAARTDSLTGVLDRPAYLSTLEVEVKRARRYGHPLAILLVRLTNLAQVNADRGHQSGDALLRQVAQSLRANTRDVDFVGRLDGSTFGVILPEQERAGAMTVAERLAGLIDTARFQIDDRTLAAQGPVGVAVYREDVGADQLVDRAREALDEARAAGIAIGVRD